MRRTLKILSLIGVATAAGVAAAKRIAPTDGSDLERLEPLPDVGHELRQALSRFEERFGT